MKKIRNVSSLGGLEVPAFRLEVDAGAVVEVSDEIAEALLEQPANWQLVEDEPKPKPKTKVEPKPSQ